MLENTGGKPSSFTDKIKAALEAVKAKAASNSNKSGGVNTSKAGAASVVYEPAQENPTDQKASAPESARNVAAVPSQQDQVPMQPTIYEVKNGADAGKHCQLNLDGTFRFPTATNNQLINTVDPNGLPIRVIGPGAHQRAKSVDVDLLNKDGSGLLGSAFGLSGEKCEILLK